MLLWILACFQEKEQAIQFPTILEPLEEIQAPLPDGDDYPEVIELRSEDSDEYASVHARGFLHLSLEDAWNALQDDLVYVNQRTVSNYTIEEPDSQIYDHVFVVNNEVQDIVTVEFTNEWRHVGNLNDKSEVSDVIVRWQKIDGTDFIQLIEGSVEILPVDGEDTVVEIRIIEHLKATLDQESNAIEFVTDMAERWRLIGHGEPIPEY